MTPSTLNNHIQALHEAQEKGDLALQAQAHARLGKTYLTRNNYREASKHYQKAREGYTSLGMNEHLARTLNHLGVCNMMLDLPQSAMKTLQRASGLEEQFHDDRLRAAIFGNMGLVHASLGDYTKALRDHRRVCELAQGLKDPQLQVQAQINMADVHLKSGQYHRAFALAQKALHRARKIGPNPSLIAVLDLLGMISSRREDLRSAVDYHDQAAQKAEELGDFQRQAIALANKALALEGLTEYDQASQAMQKAQEIFLRLRSNYQTKTERDLKRIRRSTNED